MALSAFRIVERLQVVEDEHERLLGLKKGLYEAWNDHVGDAGPRPRQRFEDPFVDRLDRLDRRGDRAEQMDGVVVPSSSEIQAKGRVSAASHSARTVVLPYPAGATSSATAASVLVTRWEVSRSRRIKPVRTPLASDPLPDAARAVPRPSGMVSSACSDLR